MRKLLKFLHVIQVSKKNGKRRVNPYNPFSYVVIIGGLLIGIVLFGFVGVWKEVDLINPFRWN